MTDKELTLKIAEKQEMINSLQKELGNLILDQTVVVQSKIDLLLSEIESLKNGKEDLL